MWCGPEVERLRAPMAILRWLAIAYGPIQESNLIEITDPLRLVTSNPTRKTNAASMLVAEGIHHRR